MLLAAQCFTCNLIATYSRQWAAEFCLITLDCLVELVNERTTTTKTTAELASFLIFSQAKPDWMRSLYCYLKCRVCHPSAHSGKEWSEYFKNM